PRALALRDALPIAHQKRAQAEDDRPPERGQAVRGLDQGGERGQQGEPGAYRTVEPAKAGIGPPRTGQPTLHPVVRPHVGKIGYRRAVCCKLRILRGHCLTHVLHHPSAINSPRRALPSRIRSSDTVTKLSRSVLTLG